MKCTRDLLEMYCKKEFDNFDLNYWTINGSEIKLQGSRTCMKGTKDQWIEDDNKTIDILDYITFVFNQFTTP